MIVCPSCKKKVSKAIFVKTQNRHYCYACYARFIERKFKANLSKNNMIDEGDILKLSKSRKPNVLAANYIFHKIFNKNPSIKLTYNNKEYTKKINYLTSEKLLIEFLNEIGKNEKYEFLLKKDEIFPCYNFLTSDLENYCKAKKIKYVQERSISKREELLQNFIDSIAKIRPGAVYSAIRTLEELEIIK